MLEHTPGRKHLCLMVFLIVGICMCLWSSTAFPASTTGVASATGEHTQEEWAALRESPKVPQVTLPEVTGEHGETHKVTSPEAPAAGTTGADGLNPGEPVPQWANHALVHFYPPIRQTSTVGGASGVKSASLNVQPALAGSGQRLTYHGGYVQREPRLYLLFWGSNFWQGENPPGLGGELEFFFRGLEKESIVNPAWQGILSQYWSYGGEAYKHAKVVAEAKVSAVVAPTKVTNAKIEEEVGEWLENGATITPNTQFVVMLAPHSTFGEEPIGCGYHEIAYYKGRGYVLDVIPYAGDINKYFGYNNCNRLTRLKTTPENQQLMWSTTGTASHEFAEATTDPFISVGEYPYTGLFGWVESESKYSETEIGDLCIDEEEAKRENAIEELPRKNGRVGWTWVNKLWDDEGGNKCKLEDPPYAEPAVAPKSSTWGLENFESTNINAFYRNASGLANEYELGGSWSNQTLTGGLVGAPAAIENTAGTNMNVFYENESGDLAYESWHSSSGWANTVMAGGISGTPAATENVADNNINAFYKSTSGQLMNEYWTPSSGWANQTLTGRISGLPAALVNTASNNMNVFYKNTSGQLADEYWTTSGGWANQVLASGVRGTPVAVENREGNNMNVFYENESGQLVDEYWVNGNPGNGWSSQVLAEGVGGTPTAVENGAGNNMNVLYRNTSGQLVDEYWVNGNPGNGWSSQVLEGGISGTPAITDNASSTNMNVFYRNTSGHLADEYWINGSGGNGWANTTLASGMLAP